MLQLLHFYIMLGMILEKQIYLKSTHFTNICNFGMEQVKSMSKNSRHVIIKNKTVMTYF